MALATDHYVAHGGIVKDVSATRSYDLEVTLGGAVLTVEVEGPRETGRKSCGRRARSDIIVLPIPTTPCRGLEHPAFRSVRRPDCHRGQSPCPRAMGRTR
jgi:hypothetical protein